jgi:hypothetical protein
MLPALDVLVMPLVVHPVLEQDLSVSAIRTFPIFTYLSHDRSIRVFRFDNKMQPLANICARGFRSLVPPTRGAYSAGAVEEIRPGDVVWFPPGEKHWHGAAPTTAMTHITIQ